MRFHLAEAAAHRFGLQICVGVSLLCAAAACTERTDTTSVDAASFQLDARSIRNTLQLSVRDSSLTVGDTLSLWMPGLPQVSTTSSSRINARFRSTDTAVIAVDSRGFVRAVGVGKATVSVRTLLGTAAVHLEVHVAGNAPSSEPHSPAPDSAEEKPGTPAPPASAPPVVSAPPVSVTPPAPSPIVTLPETPGRFPSFTAPQLPQATVDVTYPSPTRTVRVAADDAAALQAALDAAIDGDEIVLPDGSTYVGSFHLPNRAGTGTVVLRSATVPVPAHSRLTPASAGTLATLRTNSVFPAIIADDGAHGWRVVSVRLQLADNVVDNYGIVTVGTGSQTSVSQFPHHITFDRVAVSGSPTGNTSRCVSLNGLTLAVIDSWLADCHAKGRDAQAVAAWTGTGPLLVENNHLEGSGQGVLLGGADPLISGVTPRDITIRRNHFFKPLDWGGGRWSVKAAFEVKDAERVLFEGNIVENHWADAQNGFAILLQAGSQDNKAPWSAVRDVTIQLNAIRNSRSGINILSRYITAGFAPIDPSRRILLRDNSFESVGTDPQTGQPGRFVQLLGDMEDVSLLQNTFYGTGASNAVIFDGAPTVRLALANNVFASATYGIIGTGAAEGSGTLAQFAPGSSVTGNVLTGAPKALYPAGNVFPTTLTLADLVSAGTGDYSLRTGLAFAILNGARVGVNGASVTTAVAGVNVR